MRARFRRLVRIAKMCATDSRVPVGLRWTFRVILAIKAVPVPDFGIDEFLLVIAGLVIVAVPKYRRTFRAIIADA